MRFNRQTGLTLVELLVVMAIVGMMVSLLLPAVQSAREAARSTSCRNNLKQLALATQNFQAAVGIFPPSFVIEPGQSLATNNGSWSIHGRLLPYIEQTEAFGRVRLDIAWDDPVNKSTGVPTMRIPTLLCPSEVNDVVRVDAAGDPKVHPQNYGFNFGRWLVYDPVAERGGDGAFFVNSRLTPARFVDGLSNTLCVAEVKAFTPYFRNTADPGPQVPSSPAELAVWASSAQFKLGPTTNDNTGHTEWPDGRVHHSGITTVFTPNTVVNYEHTDGLIYDIDCNSRQEGKSVTQPTYAAVTARSYHPGRVHVSMMDGSVSSVPNEIDIIVWQQLSTRDGRGVAGSQ